MSEQPPPDPSSLTPEEWDAVRRLRERSVAAETSEPEAPAQESTAQESTAQPLPPVAPTPPPEQTAPPVTASLPEPVPATAAEPIPEPVSEPVSERRAEPVVGEPPASDGRRETRGPAASVALPALAALLVLAVVAVVLAGLASLKVSHNHDKNQASTAALAAATSGVASVLSYNYKSLDADFAKAEALLTPTFRKSYETTTAKAVQPLAAKYKAVSTAQVSAAGVISASSSKARVLVFVSQQVTNTQLSAPRLDRSRIEVELVHSHGQWLINKLTPL